MLVCLFVSLIKFTKAPFLKHFRYAFGAKVNIDVVRARRPERRPKTPLGVNRNAAKRIKGI